MFSWYQKALQCLVYMKDVPSGINVTADADVIMQSEWWTRGWTLQELLAPKWLIFISKDWRQTLRSREDFGKIILEVTGIRKDDYRFLPRGEVSVARRMSWASRRTCTREEDEAYCLMGIFKVSMPPLYGEGRNAFQRLQAEILKKSDDESIFAWWTDESVRNDLGTAMLASSPRDFQHSAHVRPWAFDHGAKPYSLTNKGLQLERPLAGMTEEADEKHRSSSLERQIHHIWTRISQFRGLYAIALNCSMPPARAHVDVLSAMAPPVLLILAPIVNTSDTYCRVLLDCSDMLPRPDVTKQMFKGDDSQIMFVKPILGKELDI